MRAQKVTLVLTLAAAFAAGTGVSLAAASTNAYAGNGMTAMSQSQDNDSSASATIATFEKKDPQVAKFVNDSYAYAVFPSVGKGGAVVGGAYGKGKVYENGRLVGHASITKFDIGAQLGGETFSELIFFKDHKTFDQFKQGGYAFSANASAVAVKAGAQASNNYEDGVAVFTMAKGGLMAGVSIGGQKFSYTPVPTPMPATGSPGD